MTTRKMTQDTSKTPCGAAGQITLGVDTHAEQHVAVALDPQGRVRGSCAVPTTTAGDTSLLTGATAHGAITCIGVEGTGSDGAGLARWLRRQGLVMVEVDRPNRQVRRRQGTSDTVDAEAAARAAQAGTATGQPKAGDGRGEAIRALRVARRSAVKARTQAVNQRHALVVTAPDALRSQLRSLRVAARVEVAARFRAVTNPGTAEAGIKAALRSIARRYQALAEEVPALDQHLDLLVQAAAPARVAVKGVGTETAGALLVAAGDNPERLRNEAAFAHLCGVAPVPASSGKTQRYRLSRGGNRDANRARYLLAIGRLGWDERARAYAARRTREGKTKPESIRCLNRYSARDIYRALTAIAA